MDLFPSALHHILTFARRLASGEIEFPHHSAGIGVALRGSSLRYG